ncbi:hypothetical protein ABZU32_28975 [Sphaerisporangium sp. NPDC005288]|uniref:Transposase n=1 Tax=Sphaerisporangium rhizosphaerae TaxID=2269375 RepID=A0ABW2PAS5_9ACTN
MKWVDSRGFEVEALVVGNQPCLRVSRGRQYVAYYPDVAELSRHLDLTDLVVTAE